MSKHKKFIIIDANSLIHRAYHALPPLTTKDGVLVNAVYGFANIFLKVLREHDPDYVAVCFDMAGGTFRDEIYEEYKAGREEKPQEFYDQFNLIHEFLEVSNVAVFEKEGYEADDLIGTLSGDALKITDAHLKKIIITGDKDMLQLVDGTTEVEMARKGVSETVIYNEKLVIDEMGFGPERVIDFKGLRGDSSDNIPGVPGIGEKTGKDLIMSYGSLEDIYKAVSKCEKDTDSCEIKPGVLKKLIEHEEQAYMSRELATIIRDVKLRYSADDLHVEPPDYEALVTFVQELGFKSLLNRIPKPETGSLFELPSSAPTKKKSSSKKNKEEVVEPSAVRTQNDAYVLIDSDAKYKKFLAELKKQKVFALDTETTALHPIEAELLGISFSWKSGTGYYLPVDGHRKLDKDLVSILENADIKKTGHNIKYDYQILKRAGIDFAGISFDTMIASYLLNPSSRSHSLDALAFSEFNHQMIPITDLLGPKGKNQLTMKDVPVEDVAYYAAEDADFSWRLYEVFSKNQELKKTLKKVFYEVELPLIPVLGDMELKGVKVDTEFLNNLSKKLGRRITTLEKKMHTIAGYEFNVASPIQLKEVLFERLGISTDGIKRTKTGVSTAASELEKLQGRHEIIDLIMEFRELAKLKNTYTDTLPKLVQEETGRVHTSYNQTVAATGRLSSTDPNLQNIPIRTELGSQIRNAFVAERGYKLVAIDYSQIELRIAASLSGDPTLVSAFKKGQDIHRATAAHVFGVAPEEVTDQQRRDAKVVNFGILYGLGSQGLARGTGMSIKEAREYLDKYFELHSKLKDFIESTKELARSEGYTETLLGRRRYFPEIQSAHPALRAQAERAAINLPIQGLNADIIKLAMIEIDKEIVKRGWEQEVKMLLQVHDELVFEVKNSLIEKASKVIIDIMEHVFSLDVPIVADVGVGKNWGAAK